MSAQKRENIIFEGEEMFISSLPNLPIKEGFVKEIEVKEKTKNTSLTIDEVGTPLSLTKEDIEKLESTVGGSNLTRGYIGSWEIKDNKLYLLNVVGKYEINATTPLFAEWFTGLLMVTSGVQLKYVHFGFKSKYETERIVEIEKGVVKKIEVIDNTN